MTDAQHEELHAALKRIEQTVRNLEGLEYRAVVALERLVKLAEWWDATNKKGKDG